MGRQPASAFGSEAAVLSDVGDLDNSPHFLLSVGVKMWRGRGGVRRLGSSGRGQEIWKMKFTRNSSLH
ncbi:hypothetical protein BaRGS_00027964 [Batillaria attramentaria]|uniref:Uncharacterized protein n=1 Tax=Batillaria attramentaria TaxID=370345 RepID=A0ABD0K0W3_9CAEN